MTDRIDRLERTNRVLVLAVFALVALQALNLLRAPAAPQGPVEVLPRAHAAPPMTFVKEAKDRPERIFTTGQSGTAIYEFTLNKDGSYTKAIWH